MSVSVLKTKKTDEEVNLPSIFRAVETVIPDGNFLYICWKENEDDGSDFILSDNNIGYTTVRYSI